MSEKSGFQGNRLFQRVLLPLKSEVRARKMPVISITMLYWSYLPLQLEKRQQIKCIEEKYKTTTVNENLVKVLG